MALNGLVEQLKRWDPWKRVAACPDRVDELEARLAALESKLKPRPRGMACPACRALEFRVERTAHNDGPLGDHDSTDCYLRCSACGHREIQMETAK